MILCFVNFYKKLKQTALIVGASGWSSYPGGVIFRRYFNLKAILNKQPDFVNLSHEMELEGLFIDIKGKKNYNNKR
jgi:hypothetical protein